MENKAYDGPMGAIWLDMTGKEVMNFLNCHAWQKVKQSIVEAAGKKPISMKTIFKTKVEQDGSLQYKVQW